MQVNEKDTRIQHLRAILAGDAYRGNKSALSRALGYDRPNYLTELLNGKKSFGEKVARNIERQLKLPLKYLDGAAPQALSVRDAPTPYIHSLTDEARSLAADWQELDPPIREQILVMIHALVAHKKRASREMKKQRTPKDNRPRPNA